MLQIFFHAAGEQAGLDPLILKSLDLLSDALNIVSPSVTFVVEQLFQPEKRWPSSNLGGNVSKECSCCYPK